MLTPWCFMENIIGVKLKVLLRVPGEYHWCGAISAPAGPWDEIDTKWI